MLEIAPEILEAVQQAAEDGRLSCPRARELASKLGVSTTVIGEACDQLKIKLYACELGCF